MSRASTTLPSQASSIPAARRWVESLLSGWGHDDLGWTAACIVSELATNAHLHARTDFTVTLSRVSDEEFLLEISDGSPNVPRPRHYGQTSTTGRGLRLVAQLGDAWGVSERGDDAPGKTVWVRLVARATTRGDGDVDAEADVDALLEAFADDSDAPAGSRRGAPPDGPRALLLAA